MFNGYYFTIQDPQLGIVAGTVEDPRQIESRLQEWQKTDNIANLINEKYGTPADREANHINVSAAINHLQTLDIDKMQQSIENAISIEDLKGVLLELCYTAKSIKAIVTGKS